MSRLIRLDLHGHSFVGEIVEKAASDFIFVGISLALPYGEGAVI